MIASNVWILLGILNRERTLQRRTRTGRVAVHQHLHEVGEIRVRPGKPVLHRQKPGPQILRRTWHEAQQLGQLLERGELTLPR